MGLEMRGSMLLYIALFSTMNFTPSWRLGALFALTLYFYFTRDVVVGFAFFAGALLADLSIVLGNTTPSSPRIHSGESFAGHRLAKKYWPIALAVFALFIGGQPDHNTDRTFWSRIVQNLGQMIFPAGGNRP